MPTSMLTTIMMPKWTGSMPSFIATGNRIGAMISTIDDGSITLPASSSSDVDEEQEGDDAEALVEHPRGELLRNLLGRHAGS